MTVICGLNLMPHNQTSSCVDPIPFSRVSPHLPKIRGCPCDDHYRERMMRFAAERNARDAGLPGGPKDPCEAQIQEMRGRLITLKERLRRINFSLAAAAGSLEGQCVPGSGGSGLPSGVAFRVHLKRLTSIMNQIAECERAI